MHVCMCVCVMSVGRQVCMCVCVCDECREAGVHVCVCVCDECREAVCVYWHSEVPGLNQSPL